MIKSLTSFLAMAFLSLSATLSAATLQIGMCDGRIADQGVGRAGACEVGAACKFPSDLREPYRGMKVTALRVALVTTDGIQNLSAWVRPSLQAQPLARQSALALSKGWNTISLDQPLTIPSAGSLWVGYSFNQTKQINAISLVGKETEDGFWYARDEKWSVPAQYPGILSVELEVTDASLPDCDLAIASYSVSPIAIRPTEKATLSFKLQNAALKEIPSYEYVCTFGGQEVARQTINQPLKSKEYYEGSIDIDGSLMPVGANYDVVFKVSAPGDENPSNDQVTRPITIYNESYEKRVLVEEFTGESCPNCPRAIRFINNAYHGDYAGKIVPVAHHCGYADDFMTNNESKAYLWFFTGKGTFAPAVMFDRTYQPGSSYESPINDVFYENVFTASIDRQLATPTFVGVEADCWHNDQGALGVDVRLERSIAFEVMSPGRKPRISVFLVEDSIEMDHQAGDIWPGFIHMHVYRKRLTPAWGNEVTWNGNHANIQFACTPDPEWNLDHLQAVAFVHDYNSNDRNDCHVYNVNTSRVRQGESGIMDVSDQAVQKAVYYNLQGQVVESPSHGVYIKREGSHVTKILL